jgi:hypothetical protein
MTEWLIMNGEKIVHHYSILSEVHKGLSSV